jgi:hypothetical protein
MVSETAKSVIIRAKNANLKYAWISSAVDEADETKESGAPQSASDLLRIYFPQERLAIPIDIGGDDHMEFVASSAFDAFRRLNDYVGVWSADKCTIEAAILSGAIPAQFQLTLLRRLAAESIVSDDDTGRLSFNFHECDLAASIGPCSDEYFVLNHAHGDTAIGRFLGHAAGSAERTRAKPITIRLDNSNALSHDQATKLLEKASNSLFFNIDLVSGRSLFLRRRAAVRSRRSRPRVEQTPMPAIAFEYDAEAMALYWYGRGAANLPLLRFLAYYQSVEFYFPRYSKAEAVKRVRLVLRDPRFDPSSDQSIAKLLARLRSTGHDRGFGGELDQLEATLAACVTDDDLRDFIAAEPERQGFFARGGDWKKVADVQIGASSTSSIVVETARRIYRIRCRIVHTKDEERDEKMILPNTREVRLMQHDIDLAEFIATKCIVASSTPFRKPLFELPGAGDS